MSACSVHAAANPKCVLASERQHNLAEMCARLHQAMRRRRFGETYEIGERAMDPTIEEFFFENTRLLGQVNYADHPVKDWLAAARLSRSVQFPQPRIIST